MLEVSRCLFLAGALPFVLLGLAHARATPARVSDEKGLSPRDPALRDAMVQARVRLTRRTSLWQAWVGFNLSHSLGAVLFGAAVLLVGRSAESYRAEAGVFLPFSVLVAALYLAIGVRYWFRTPVVGLALALACFTGAWVVALAHG